MTTATLEQVEAPKALAPAKMRMPLSSLVAALDKISPALPGPSSLIPILRNVRVENGFDSTSLIATDLDMSIRATVEGSSDEGGAWLVSSDRLLSYIKLLQGEEVSITPNKARATLLCGRSKTQLPLDQIANYPQTTFGEYVPDDSAPLIPQSLLLRLLKYTGFAVSTEESRYTIAGALLALRNGRLTMAATDGHRLAVYSAPFDGPAFEQFILPLNLMKSLTRALADDSTLSVRIGSDTSSLMLNLQGSIETAITHRKMSGAFPNYEAVVPKDSPISVTVNSTEMLASLGRCVAMSDKASFAVKLTVSPDSIVLVSKDASAGEAEETIGVTSQHGTFAPFSSGFNGTYLMDVLKRLRGDVTLGWTKAAGDVAIKLTASPEDGEELVYVVMPMRVS